jgi:hypothetical protein
MSLSNNFPVNSSNLNLSLANAGRLDPRVTFTRASTGTYYDGYSSAKAEENLFLQSQDFTTTWATSTATVSANAGNAPDGTATADKVLPDLATTGRVQQTLTTTTGITYTFSCFVKADGFGWVALGMAAPGAYFDLSGAGTVGTTPAGYTASITSVGSGWYRCVVTLTETGGASRTWRINPASADNTLAVGDGTSGILVWGAQLEQRSSVTSYTATTTAPITNYIPVLQTAAADVPRFDHNPTTRAALGLLVEEQRANLFTYSDDFANAAWTKTRSSITSNIIVAPNGTLTGDTFVEDTTASNSHRLSQTFSATSGTTYTASVFVKAQSTRCLRIVFATAFASDAATINPTSGATQVNSGTTATSVSSVGNGWYRFTVSATATSTATASIEFYTTTALNTSVSYTGDGYSGVFIWGAQLEAGAFPTSYIATTTASVTRNADVASMTGTNFSGFYNQTEGTFFAEATSAWASGNIVGSSDGTNNNRIFLGIASGPVSRLLITTSGSSVAAISVAYTLNTFVKGAGAYKLNNSQYAANTVLGTEDTVCTIPTVDRLSIGTNTSANDFFLNGTIRTIRYYPVRNSNAQLQALTG